MPPAQMLSAISTLGEPQIYPGASLFRMLRTCSTTLSPSIWRGCFECTTEGTKSAQDNLQGPPVGMGRAPLLSPATRPVVRDSQSPRCHALPSALGLRCSYLRLLQNYSVRFCLPAEALIGLGGPTAHSKSYTSSLEKGLLSLFCFLLFQWTSQVGTKFALLLQGTWKKME